MIRKTLICGILAAAVLVGCGGSGTSTVQANQFAKYRDLINQVAKDVSSAGSTGTPGRSARATSREELSVGSKYYSEWNELWARIDEYEVQKEETPEGGERVINFKQLVSMYLDEALTQSAGFLRFIGDEAGNQDYEQRITAGKYAGYLFKNVKTVGEGSSWTRKINVNDTINNSTQAIEMSFIPSEQKFTYSYDISVQGKPTRYSGTIQQGEQRFTYLDSRGFTTTWLRRADQSGEFKIEGNDPLLPATGTWNAEGKGIVKFADGTELPLDFSEGTFSF